MRCSLARARHQHSPFEGVAKGLLRTPKDREHRRTAKARQQRSEGTNPLHKAQYIGAFVDAHSTMMSRQQQRRMDTAMLLDAAAITPAEGRSSDTNSAASLLSLAKELEDMYATTERGMAVSSRPSSKTTGHRSTREEARAVAFGEWRTDHDDVLRQSRAADFLLHCVLREARTPPGWSPEAFRRVLPLRNTDVRRHFAFAARARPTTSSSSATAAAAFAAELCARQQRLVHGGGKGRGGLVLSESQARALTSLTLQTLVAETHSWRVAHAYLLAHLATTTTASPAGALPQCRSDVSQQLAVFAEAVRYADLQDHDPVPLEQLETLMEAAHNRIGQLAAGEGGRGGMSPVVCAPVLSILTCGGGPAQLRALCERHLFHYKSCTTTAANQSGDTPRMRGGGAARLVYMPAAAWGEYLRAMRRSGASLHEIQAATDDITDPAKTQQAAEKLVRSVHVWNGYLASVHDAAHAMTVFESNRKHYGLRETPATIAVLMDALARHGNGEESVEKGLQLYRKLQASAGEHLVGGASVLVSLLALHEVSGNLKELLRFCVDYPNVLVYFGVPEAWWSGESQGAQLLRHLASATPETGPRSLAALAPAYLDYFDSVCERYSVPPVVAHCLHRAVEVVQTRLTGDHENVDRPQSAIPTLSAEQLMDML